MNASTQHTGQPPGSAVWNEVAVLTAFFVAASALSFWIYSGAMHGGFISDDTFFVVGLGRNHTLDWEFLRKAFAPFGELRYEVMNYSPLYALASRVEWELFGWSTYEYHAVNVVLHAANATLLVALARSASIGLLPATFAGAFFLLHPANVEAVAWISQLRSILGLGFAMGAILALRRYPLIATVLFAAALLFKVAALFALPLAAGLVWCSKRDPHRQAISWFWIALWAACLALYAVPQFSSWGYFGAATVDRYADGAEQLRSMAEIGMRYLVMAVTSVGVSAFHEPEPAHSWLDPWWLASLPIAALLLWRMIDGLARRNDEGAYWLGAAAAFAPISQITPFYFAMGDRYLYFVLPALIVAILLWAKAIRARSGLAVADSPISRMAIGLLACAVLIVFAGRSMQRAPLFESVTPLAREAQANYPNGGLAHWMRALELLSAGEIDAGLREFEGVIDTGYYTYVSLFNIPSLARYHQLPEFVALRKRLARMTIENFEKSGTPSQKQARMAATAHYFLEEYDAALEKFEAALEMAGPDREKIQAEIAQTRQQLGKSQQLPN